MNYGISLKETIYAILESEKVYLKKYWVRTSQMQGEMWTSKLMTLIDHPKILTPKSAPREPVIK